MPSTVEVSTLQWGQGWGRGAACPPPPPPELRREGDRQRVWGAALRLAFEGTDPPPPPTAGTVGLGPKASLVALQRHHPQRGGDPVGGGQCDTGDQERRPRQHPVCMALSLHECTLVFDVHQTNQGSITHQLPPMIDVGCKVSGSPPLLTRDAVIIRTLQRSLGIGVLGVSQFQSRLDVGVPFTPQMFVIVRERPPEALLCQHLWVMFCFKILVLLEAGLGEVQ